MAADPVYVPFSTLPRVEDGDQRPPHQKHYTIQRPAQTGDAVNINIEDIRDLCTAEPGYLLGTLHIMDVPHHVALLEVIDDEGTQRAPDEASTVVDAMLDDLAGFDGASKPYRTVLYQGKEYVVAITPYCQ